MIKIKWIYDKPDIHDGIRILIERKWPRGMRRSSQNVDIWMKRIGPSEDLHKWYLHNTNNWAEYERRYKREIVRSIPFKKLLDIVKNTDMVTLLFTNKDHERNDAVIVWRALQDAIIREERGNE